MSSLQGEFCDMLLVCVDDVLHVVDAPAGNAVPGDLVEFKDSFGQSHLGKVHSLVRCKRGSDEIRFLRQLQSVNHATAIFKKVWPG